MAKEPSTNTTGKEPSTPSPTALCKLCAEAKENFALRLFLSRLGSELGEMVAIAEHSVKIAPVLLDILSDKETFKDEANCSCGRNWRDFSC